MQPDTAFYLAAIPAVILVGLTKGGMGEALSMMGVPLLAMVVSPVQAAAILLPILIFMDWISLWIWRKHGNGQILKVMLPGALIGIAVGWATAALVPASLLRMLIGATTILFALRYFYNRYRAGRGIPVTARSHNPVAGGIWGMLSGYTSFVTHAGGPPFQIYTLPLGLDPKDLTGASVRFFAIVNAIKFFAYWQLGQFDSGNLFVSLTLMPFAPFATIAGAWIVKRMRPETYYPVMYAMALIAAIKLFVSGLPV
jgi:uncharacterized membrane protein YfcA